MSNRINIRQIRWVVNLEVTKMAYHALVESHIRYSLVIWESEKNSYTTEKGVLDPGKYRSKKELQTSLPEPKTPHITGPLHTKIHPSHWNSYVSKQGITLPCTTPRMSTTMSCLRFAPPCLKDNLPTFFKALELNSCKSSPSDRRCWRENYTASQSAG